VKEDHSLWCWGYVPTSGQVTSARFVYAPTQYWNDSPWSALASSALHVCGTKLDGSLWCWGSNSAGELAQGDLWSTDLPLRVGSDVGWTRLMLGWEHTCARKQTPGSSESALWCWGHNYSGQASVSDEDEIREPNKIPGSELWRAESAGSFFNCAITDERTIVCWGQNNKGQLGDGTTTKRAEPAPIASDFHDWVSLSAGGDNACAIRADGSLWCWGANDAGQIGDGTATTRLEPVRVGSASNWTQVSVSRLTYPNTNYDFVRETPATCALNKLGELWCWGENRAGRLGDGTSTAHYTPEPVDGSRDWSTVVLGARHACALKRDHTLWCWGVDYHGQLGNPAQARPRRALDP
jgi:alpha-tubulin suppressor-like RCC1 family protein